MSQKAIIFRPNRFKFPVYPETFHKRLMHMIPVRVQFIQDFPQREQPFQEYPRIQETSVMNRYFISIYLVYQIMHLNGFQIRRKKSSCNPGRQERGNCSVSTFSGA